MPIDNPTTPADVTESHADLLAQLAAVRHELALLQDEHADLQLMYEGTIEHGEAVEDELAEKNLQLIRTQHRLEQELTEAAAYVMSILPPPRLNPQTEWLLIPSTELGGDSFGYHDIDPDHLAMYLLDVCGHGVGAALLSASAINVLRSSALPNTDFRDPSMVMCALNEAFPMERQNNMYFTIWYGVYQRSTGELRYCSGGHPPSVLLPAATPGHAVKLVTANLPPGTFPDLDYEADSCRVHPGDCLILLSDGAFEITRPDGSQLMFDEFVEFLALPGGREPQRVLDWVRSMNGEGPLADDFSFLRVNF